MSKATYIGVNTNIPIYENRQQTVTITASNISNYFTVTNGAYYFAGSGSTFTTNNGGKHNTTATTTLTAKQDISALSFNYSYSSESHYDKFTLKVAGTTVENAVSGATTSKSYSGTLSSGQTIEFTYSKDVSNNSYSDKCTFSNMSITCIGKVQTGSEIRSVARKVKNIYIGVNTNIPIYENRQQTVTITASNISNYFTVTNGDYYFAGSGSTFTTNNGSKNSTTATTTLTAKQDISALSFNYSYSSEANYDKFTLKVAGTTVENAVSGDTTSKTYNGSLSSGQTIEFIYAKDNSQSSNDDKCTFSNMSITFIGRVQTGSTTKSVAKKVKKGYIGVNGIARQFFTSSIIRDSFKASSTVKGTPTYSYTISSDKKTLTMQLTSMRTTNSNYDTDRNLYYVYISAGIKAGDSVSFIGTNTYPKASQECGVVTQGGVIVKTWQEHGTNVTYSFTANANGDLQIVVDDGDYNQSEDTVTFTISNLTVNGTIILFE